MSVRAAMASGVDFADVSNLVTLERLGIVEHWFPLDAAMFFLLRDPVRCAHCGEAHHFFVNRDGRTRCCFCDDVYRAACAALKESP